MNVTADPIFVRKIVTSLEFEIFMPGSTIVAAGQYFNDVFFIQRNDVLLSDLFLRFNICKLGPRSFFGEHEVLFNMPSQFTYSASD